MEINVFQMQATSLIVQAYRSISKEKSFTSATTRVYSQDRPLAGQRNTECGLSKIEQAMVRSIYLDYQSPSFTILNVWNGFVGKHVASRRAFN